MCAAISSAKHLLSIVSIYLQIYTAITYMFTMLYEIWYLQIMKYHLFKHRFTEHNLIQQIQRIIIDMP